MAIRDLSTVRAVGPFGGFAGLGYGDFGVGDADWGSRSGWAHVDH